MPTTHVQLVYPMCAMVFLTVVVLIIMFRRRVKAVISGQVKMAHFKTFSVGEAPEGAVQASRHFSNLFEIPVLFYVACIVGMILPVQNFGFVICAWLFVMARGFHAGIHLGSNNVRPRMSAFAVGVLILVIMWVMILMKALTVAA